LLKAGPLLELRRAGDLSCGCAPEHLDRPALLLPKLLLLGGSLASLSQARHLPLRGLKPGCLSSSTVFLLLGPCSCSLTLSLFCSAPGCL
jgi:hypothetical protein